MTSLSRPPRAPTLDDVARAAGVSAMTVSRILSDQRSIKDATYLNVHAAVREVGYHANSAAKMLAGAKAFRVSLLHASPSANYLSEFLVGCLERASRRNLEVVITDITKCGGAGDLHSYLVNAAIAAVILPPPLCDDGDIVNVISGAGIPLVLVELVTLHRANRQYVSMTWLRLVR